MTAKPHIPPHIPKTDTTAELDHLRRLARRFDALFHIPGTRIRVGLDSLLGLLPGVGDAAAIAPAVYLVYRAQQMGASTPTLLRMSANVGIDALVGSIPLLGDLFDVAFKANIRNIDLLERDLGERGREPLLQPAE